MGWRDDYRVHPAADVFPMMSDEELAALAEDIKANGVRVPIGFWGKYENGRFDGELIDGRNRLRAAEIAGLDPNDIPRANLHCGDPVTWIIALNIRRRHLTPQRQLDLIVAARMAVNKPGHDGPVSKGGRGKVNPVKAAVMADAKAAGLDPSERTVKRSIAKAEGRAPKRRTDAEIERDGGIEAFGVSMTFSTTLKAVMTLPMPRSNCSPQKKESAPSKSWRTPSNSRRTKSGT